MYTKKTDVAYYMCNVKTYYLNVVLSLTKLQNGDNSKKFNYIKACDLIEKINADLQKTTQNEFFNVDWGQLCRIDLNQDFTFKNEKHANEVMRFLNSLPNPRMKIKKTYDTGFSFRSSKTNKTELRIYRKDLDKNLDESIRNSMKPTARMEFEYNKARNIRSFFGTANLTEILLNPQLALNAFHKKLHKYKLSAVLFNKKQFIKVAKKALEVKEKTFAKYKKILKKGWKNKKLTPSEKRKFSEICNKLFKCDIIPGYCDVDVSFISALTNKFLKKFTKKMFEYFNRIKNKNKRNENKKRFKNYNYIRYNRFDSS